MNERKQAQLEHALRGAVQEVVGRGLADPRIRGLITITQVEVTQDRRTATVHVSVFPEDRVELTMHGLQDASRHIRHEVGELVRTRTMPELVFKRDDRIKKEGAVLRAINLARQEREDTLPPSADGDQGAGDAAPPDQETRA